MGTSSAVCIAHPGHELLIHEWLRRERPLVFILTDGSGYEGQARLEDSRRLLDRVGAPLAARSGRFTDKEAYELILEQRSHSLLAMIEEFAAELIQHRVRVVVADASEGYNPVHDVSRMIAGVACALAGLCGPEPAHYEFSTVDPHVSTPGADELVLRLTDAQLEEKIAAAHDYWSLRDEVSPRLGVFGSEALRMEVMPRVLEWRLPPTRGLRPAYERTGEQRVANGRYQRVIRYREHMVPLQQSLIAWLEERSAHSHHQRIARRSGWHAGLRP